MTKQQTKNIMKMAHHQFFMPFCMITFAFLAIMFLIDWKLGMFDKTASVVYQSIRLLLVIFCSYGVWLFAKEVKWEKVN
jgi:hypothetical protein